MPGPVARFNRHCRRGPLDVSGRYSAKSHASQPDRPMSCTSSLTRRRCLVNPPFGDRDRQHRLAVPGPRTCARRRTQIGLLNVTNINARVRLKSRASVPGKAAALTSTRINGITTTNCAAISATTGIPAPSLQAIPAVTASDIDPLTNTQCEAFKYANQCNGTDSA